MKKHLFILILISVTCCTLHAAKIVIVGAGPCGLAAAIEAATRGNSVTVIEMRDSYTRKQTILLTQESIALLEKWQVSLDACHKTETMGMMVLQELEAALKKRLTTLGVMPITALYKTVRNKQAIVQMRDGTEAEIAYDILIAADGMHSKVRQDANIPLKCYATAVGKIAFIENQIDTKDAFTPTKEGDLFVMKIPIPSKNATVFCMQAAGADDSKIPQSIQEQSPIYSDWFTLPLQQATRFYDEEKSIILVGDAAATASYLQGSGLNTGLQTAHLAGQCLDAHEYNNQAQQLTDKLINESLFLYSNIRDL